MISVLYSLKKFCKNSLSKCWISYGLYVSKFSRSSFAFGSSRLWDQLNSKFFSHPPLLSSTPWLRHCNREPWVTQGVWHSLHASFMHSLRKGQKIAGRLEKKCCMRSGVRFLKKSTLIVHSVHLIEVFVTTEPWHFLSAFIVFTAMHGVNEATKSPSSHKMW